MSQCTPSLQSRYDIDQKIWLSGKQRNRMRKVMETNRYNLSKNKVISMELNELFGSI